jgi:hypothetical protein
VASTDIPKVTDTDIEREDLEEAAQELGIEEFESLGDQELFEAVGRRLGEIEDEDEDASDEDGDEQASERDEATGSEQTDDESDTQRDDGLLEEIQADLEAMTRDELREELRGLGLPVSGSKAELAERLEAVRVGQASAGSNGQAAADAAGGGTKAAKDTAEETASQAEDTAEGSSGEDGDEAADDTGDEASDEVTEDRKQARDRGEYRVEEDKREEVKPILDLELGPLALDLLGLDVHLNRVHAVLVANPGPKHALLGKLLAAVAVAGDKLGLKSVTDTVTDGVESVVDALPTPDTGIDDDEEEDEDGGSGGILSRLASAGIGAARSAVDVARHGSDALGNAKDAAKDSITSGGKLSAAKSGKDAVGDVKDAAKSAKNVATGGE